MQHGNVCEFSIPIPQLKAPFDHEFSPLFLKKLELEGNNKKQRNIRELSRGLPPKKNIDQMLGIFHDLGHGLWNDGQVGTQFWKCQGFDTSQQVDCFDKPRVKIQVWCPRDFQGNSIDMTNS